MARTSDNTQGEPLTPSSHGTHGTRIALIPPRTQWPHHGRDKEMRLRIDSVIGRHLQRKSHNHTLSQQDKSTLMIEHNEHLQHTTTEQCLQVLSE